MREMVVVGERREERKGGPGNEGRRVQKRGEGRGEERREEMRGEWGMKRGGKRSREGRKERGR